MSPSAEKDARPTHVVYRITHDLRYQETPCSCPADRAHSILDTRPIPPGME